MTPRVVAVTFAQRRVVGELCRDGATNDQIATRLSLSANTVKSHMKDVLTRTGLPSRTALAVALLRRELLLHTTTRPHKVNGGKP